MLHIRIIAYILLFTLVFTGSGPVWTKCLHHKENEKIGECLFIESVISCFCLLLLTFYAGEIPLVVNEPYNIYKGTVVEYGYKSHAKIKTPYYDFVIKEDNELEEKSICEVYGEDVTFDLGSEVIICDYVSDFLMGNIVAVDGIKTQYAVFLEHGAHFWERVFVFLGLLIFCLLEIRCMSRTDKKHLKGKERFFWLIWKWGVIGFFGANFLSIFWGNYAILLSVIAKITYPIYLIGKMAYILDEDGIVKKYKPFNAALYDEELNQRKPTDEVFKPKVDKSCGLSLMTLEGSYNYREYIWARTLVYVFLLDCIGGIGLWIGMSFVKKSFLNGMPKGILVYGSIGILFYATVIMLIKGIYLNYKMNKDPRICCEYVRTQLSMNTKVEIVCTSGETLYYKSHFDEEVVFIYVPAIKKLYKESVGEVEEYLPGWKTITNNSNR